MKDLHHNPLITLLKIALETPVALQKLTQKSTVNLNTIGI